MLKKKLGIEAIERKWDHIICGTKRFFKIPPKLNIPEGCKWIGNYAFFRCFKLREVVIPRSARWIGDYAFYKCCKNTTIILKKSKSEFIRIGIDAFEGCKGV